MERKKHNLNEGIADRITAVIEQAKQHSQFDRYTSLEGYSFTLKINGNGAARVELSHPTKRTSVAFNINRLLDRIDETCLERTLLHIFYQYVILENPCSRVDVLLYGAECQLVMVFGGRNVFGMMYRHDILSELLQNVIPFLHNWDKLIAGLCLYTNTEAYYRKDEKNYGVVLADTGISLDGLHATFNVKHRTKPPRNKMIEDGYLKNGSKLKKLINTLCFRLDTDLETLGYVLVINSIVQRCHKDRLSEHMVVVESRDEIRQRQKRNAIRQRRHEKAPSKPEHTDTDPVSAHQERVHSFLEDVISDIRTTHQPTTSTPYTAVSPVKRTGKKPRPQPKPEAAVDPALAMGNIGDLFGSVLDSVTSSK